MISEGWTGKNAERSGRALILSTIPEFAGGTEESHEKPSQASGPRFKPVPPEQETQPWVSVTCMYTLMHACVVCTICAYMVMYICVLRVTAILGAGTGDSPNPWSDDDDDMLYGCVSMYSHVCVCLSCRLTCTRAKVNYGYLNSAYIVTVLMLCSYGLL
jgi:hypothetical protein